MSDRLDIFVPRLGVDIGNVIMTSDTDNPDRSVFGDDFLKTPQVEGAFDTLAEITASNLWGPTVLISKCGLRVQDRTLQWLEAQKFYEKTGVAPSNVYFCRERSDKAAIAAGLAVTHFVDDRLDVLSYMPSTMNKILFTMLSDAWKQNIPRDVKQFGTWQEINTHLLS